MDSPLKNRARWAISYVVDTKGQSNRKIAEVTGVTEETVGSYRNQRSDPKPDFIAKFCDVYEFDPIWFLYGRGEPFPGAREKYPEACGDIHPRDEIRVSDVLHIEMRGPDGMVKENEAVYQHHIVIPEAGSFDPSSFDFVPMAEAHLSGGGGAFVLSEKFKEFYAFRKEWLHRIATSPKNMVLMPIRGNSMHPTIQDGDVVMLDTGRTRVFDGQIYALGLNETIMIKRLENIVGGRIRIISENRKEYPPYEVPVQDVRILGQVIWFARELVPRE